MKRLLFSAIALAGLSGCATYDQVSGGAAGGYYSGSPSYRYSYPGGYYGGYGGAYRYGYGGYGAGYGGYGYWPGFYGYYSRPSYVIHPPARRRGDHDGHDDHHHGQRPPPVAGGGNRGDRPATGGPRPWRPAEGHQRPPSMRDEHRARAQSPNRQRSPNGDRCRPLSKAKCRSHHQCLLDRPARRSRARRRRLCQGSLTSALGRSVTSAEPLRVPCAPFKLALVDRLRRFMT
jgi:hypothetical protein